MGYRAGRIFVQLAYWGSLVFSLFCGAVLRVDAATLAAKFPALVDYYNIIIATSPITLPLATVAVALSANLKKSFIPTEVEESVKSLLDGFVREFADEKESDLTHRVTLFRFIEFRPSLIFTHFKLPWHGCLVPFERSGEYRLTSSTVLLASKENPDGAQGVAGVVFKKRLCEAINNLPGIDKDSNDQTIERYAKDTNCPRKWIDERREKGAILPRSFWGIPIEVNGKIWGVLLIDSRNECLPKSDLLKRYFGPYGSCLSNLLKGAK